jgi:hypothetical protein
MIKITLLNINYFSSNDTCYKSLVGTSLNLGLILEYITISKEVRILNKSQVVANMGCLH